MDSREHSQNARRCGSLAGLLHIVSKDGRGKGRDLLRGYLDRRVSRCGVGASQASITTSTFRSLRLVAPRELDLGTNRVESTTRVSVQAQMGSH
jgi:hypothetical protein